MGVGRAYTGLWWGYLRERDRLGDQGVDGRIILKGFSKSSVWGYGFDRGASG
jgi:hypothetical protein